MTTAEALGAIIVSYYDKVELEGLKRATVIEAIPPQLRFVNAEGSIASMGTITMVFDYLQKLKKNPKPILAPIEQEAWDWDDFYGDD